MSTPDERTAEQVRRKAARMRKAREDKQSLWSTIARTGAVGWQLALPLVAGALLGRLLARLLDVPQLGLAGLLLGLAMGLWGAWRAIAASIDPPEPEP